jgi:hypothetical protein
LRYLKNQFDFNFILMCSIQWMLNWCPLQVLGKNKSHIALLGFPTTIE